MNTSKPISTISFNTESFLHAKLDELVDNRTLSFYAYIKHYAEPSENNDTLKDHYHIFVEPNKRIDAMALRTEFKEAVSLSEPPLGCLPFQFSKFDDWYYYGLHDPIYLARKGMSRYYSYSRTDIVTSDKDYLSEKINSLNTFEHNCYVDIAKYQDKGFTYSQYIIARGIHPMQIRAFCAAWEIVLEAKNSATHKTEEASDESHLLEDKNLIVK